MSFSQSDALAGGVVTVVPVGSFRKDSTFDRSRSSWPAPSRPSLKIILNSSKSMALSPRPPRVRRTRSPATLGELVPPGSAEGRKLARMSLPSRDERGLQILHGVLKPNSPQRASQVDPIGRSPTPHTPHGHQGGRQSAAHSKPMSEAHHQPGHPQDQAHSAKHQLSGVLKSTKSLRLSISPHNGTPVHWHHSGQRRAPEPARFARDRWRGYEDGRGNRWTSQGSVEWSTKNSSALCSATFTLPCLAHAPDFIHGLFVQEDLADCSVEASRVQEEVACQSKRSSHHPY